MTPASSQGTRRADNTHKLGLSSLEISLMAGGTMLLLVFMYLMRDMLHPPILAAAGMILLWPARHHRPVQAILFTGGFLLIIWFSFTLGNILIAFGTIYLLAYLFNPVVSYLKIRFKIARWISSLMVTGLFISIISLCILLLAPHLLDQIDALGKRTLSSIQSLQSWLLTSSFMDELKFAGINKQELIDEITLSIQAFLTQGVNSIPDSFDKVFSSVTSVIKVITGIVIAPALLFYTLKDYPLIKKGIKHLMPTIGGKQLYLSQISVIVGRYLRGQLTISVINALVVTIGLLIADIPFALLIGIAAGLLNMIPNLGAIITVVLGIGIALIFGQRGIVDVVLVSAILFFQSMLEQSVLVPKILSHHIGLHPILILFSLFVFGHFFGIFGLFIAVPVTALITTSYTTLRRYYSIDLSSFFTPAPTVTSHKETFEPLIEGQGVTIREVFKPNQENLEVNPSFKAVRTESEA